MVSAVRAIAYGGFAGGILALCLVAPAQMGALAEEPVKAVASTIGDLFPADQVDPKIFRKYAITFDDSVSTEVTRTQVVKKIGHGRTSQVTIVTTPSGTYSTDGILSPNVRYPGIEKTSKGWGGSHFSHSSNSQGGRWISFSNGSFTYFSYVAASARS